MKKRRVVSMLIMAVMAVSLVGCGSDEKKPTTTDTAVNTTTNNEDANAPATSPDDDSEPTNSQIDPPTDTDEKVTTEEESTKETIFLTDGPKNPTHRKVYEVPSIFGDYIANGEFTLDELLEEDPRVFMSEEKIEYTDQGYIVTSTYNNSEQGLSVDRIVTYNSSGEIVHIKRTRFDSENPEGVVSCDVDYAQCHAYGGVDEYVGNCTSDIEVDSEGKIVCINKVDSNFYTTNSHNGCCVHDGMDVVQEKNRTIFYDATTCDIFDVESRKNYTVLKNGYFEMISYNSDGKIESISYASGFEDGKDSEGNTYDSINEYVDYAINEGNKVYTEVEWIYDKNGNILMILGKDYDLYYVY